MVLAVVRHRESAMAITGMGARQKKQWLKWRISGRWLGSVEKKSIGFEVGHHFNSQ